MLSKLPLGFMKVSFFQFSPWKNKPLPQALPYPQLQWGQRQTDCGTSQSSLLCCTCCTYVQMAGKCVGKVIYRNWSWQAGSVTQRASLAPSVRHLPMEGCLRCIAHLPPAPQVGKGGSLWGFQIYLSLSTCCVFPKGMLLLSSVQGAPEGQHVK